MHSACPGSPLSSFKSPSLVSVLEYSTGDKTSRTLNPKMEMLPGATLLPGLSGSLPVSTACALSATFAP